MVITEFEHLYKPSALCMMNKWYKVGHYQDMDNIKSVILIFKSHLKVSKYIQHGKHHYRPKNSAGFESAFRNMRLSNITSLKKYINIYTERIGKLEFFY